VYSGVEVDYFWGKRALFPTKLVNVEERASNKVKRIEKGKIEWKWGRGSESKTGKALRETDNLGPKKW